MKKLITFGFAAIAATATFAAANDLLITFSTPGPDTYADGTTVLDGERYALCWSEDFSQFKINPNGTAEGGKIVLKARIAKDGRCPVTVFQVSAEKAPTGGEWAVYLLDTRTFAADGTASIPASLAAAKVNTSGLAGASVTVGSGTLESITGVAGAKTDVLADTNVAAPQITGIRVADGYVYVTVKGAPYLGYGLVEGLTPDTVTTDVEGASAQATGEEEITIVTDAKEGGAFFKVNQK